MRIAIVTDAWFPQRNGVVRVLNSLRGELQARGDEVGMISPDQFRTVPLPSYPEIPLAVLPGRQVARQLAEFAPQAVHIATEGPLGWAARAWCLKRRLPFTTAYHTQFPHYLKARTGVPLPLSFAVVRRFHRPSSAVLVPSPSVCQELSQRGFRNLRQWSHGVDTAAFRPRTRDFFGEQRPIFMYVGRVTVDKNLPAFLDLDLPGRKIVVGDGPARPALTRRYPQVTFHVANGDDELSRCYSAADAFVFPSRTDTFGLVILEALACGVPVAAFPVTGPRDVLAGSDAGILSEDLRAAALQAMDIPPERCLAHAARFSWAAVADQFLSYLRPFA